MQEGRVVGLDAHARMYRDAAENLAYLMRKYSGDPKVHFRAVDNTGGVGQTRLMPLKKPGRSAILQENCSRNSRPRWKKNMPQEESLRQFIERLSALPPRQRLEEWRAIPDQTIRRQVAIGMSPDVHADMVVELMIENLNRNALESVASRKPSLAA
jgi:hypothetical protein